MIDPRTNKNPQVAFADSMPDNVRRIAPTKPAVPAPAPAPMLVTPTADPRRGATSASNAEADDLCPGRHNAQKGIPDSPKDYSDMGTRIHAALAGELDPATLEYEEREIMDNCRELERRHVVAFFGSEEADSFTRILTHERYWVLVPPERRFEHSGEADFTRRQKNRLLILDYKTLRGEVAESPRNKQLRDLAVLAAGSLPGVTEVGVAIIQPMVTWEIDICLYKAADLKIAEKEMFDRVHRSNDPNAKRIPGAVQCKFCKAAQQNKCLEYQQFAGAMVLGTADILSIPVDAWSPEQRGVFLNRKAIAQKWLDDCDEKLREIAKQDPAAVQGWELAPGATRETIVNAQTVFERFIASGGKPEQFTQCVSVTKGKLKEQLHEVTKLKGKSLDQELKRIIDGATTEKQNAPSWKKVGDK